MQHILTVIFMVIAIMYLKTFAANPDYCVQAEENGYEITAACQAIADEWNAENGVK